MIEIIDYTSNPLEKMGEVAAICWDSEPHKGIAKSCLRSGHGRVSEFASITVRISEYSARVIRELYTHVEGVSRLQRSTRYVDEGNFGYYVPPSIQENPEALGIYHSTMYAISDAYRQLEDLGIPKQDSANLLPLGSHTMVNLQINIRALIHLCNTRKCLRTLREFRDLLEELLPEVSMLNDEYKYIVKNYCVSKCISSGYCNEDHSCGLMPKKEDVLNTWKIINKMSTEDMIKDIKQKPIIMMMPTDSGVRKLTEKEYEDLKKAMGNQSGNIEEGE